MAMPLNVVVKPRASVTAGCRRKAGLCHRPSGCRFDADAKWEVKYAINALSSSCCNHHRRHQGSHDHNAERATGG